MSTRRIGPYRLVSEIGTGGMGQVFLAEAVEETPVVERGRRVALKLVHPHLLRTPGFFKRFLREARIGRQVNHENVVRTLDADAGVEEDSTIHYLVMEYVEGRSLRDLLQEHGVVPEGLVREIAAQVCRGLEAIHELGIVHRDLKPENVLITCDHRVRIMDLGVARLQEASVPLTKEGQFAGSVLYAAPEQFRQQPVEPPADLYSLGVVLYELATGVNPFRRETPAAVIRAHLEESSPPVSDRNAEVSVFFSEVVSTLLAKEPAERFPSAAALRRVLEEGEASVWWADREKALHEAGLSAPRIAVRRETKLQGRQVELLALREAWARARAGDGSFLLLEGEAGIGKTRLADALVREVDGETAHVLYGSYTPSGGSGGLSDAIVQHFGAAELAGVVRRHLGSSASQVSAFAALVRHESPPPGITPLSGEALQAVMVRLIRQLSRDRPVLWIVDDLHFAEVQSRHVVLALARAVAGYRILLVGTTRPGLPDDELANFSRLDHSQRLLLGRLSPREVVELLRDVFRSKALADKLGARIAYKSDGIPFFIFEMIRALREGRFVEQLPDGSYMESRVVEDIEVPSAVRDLIEARLQDLDDEVRNVLDVGAVQGYEFDPDLVRRVLGLESIPLLQMLAHVARRTGIIRSQGRDMVFDHHQIQEVLLRQIPQPLREEYHTQLAEALRVREGVQPDEVDALDGETAFFLARHYLRGNTPRDAAPFLRCAVAHLARYNRHERLAELAERALDVPELLVGPQRADLLLRRAASLARVGRREEERTDLEAARRVADETGAPDLQARALDALGTHLRRGGRLAEGREILERGLELARVARDRQLEAVAIGSVAGMEWESGHPEHALVLFERQCEMAREIGHRRLEARVHGNIGGVLFSLGRGEEGRTRLEQAVEMVIELDDIEGQVHHRGNLSLICLELGRLDEATSHCEAALTLAREIGDRPGESHLRARLGNIAASRGLVDEARAQLTRALELARDVGHVPLEAMCLGNLGNLAYDEGCYVDALELQQQTLHLAREAEDPRAEARALVAYGITLGALGDLEASQQHQETALSRARRIRALELEAFALSCLASGAEDAGDLDAAHRRGEQALEILERIEYAEEIASALLLLGRIALAAGRLDAARAQLEDAEQRGRGLELQRTATLAACHLARLPDADPAHAIRMLEQHRGDLRPPDLLEANYCLWRSTGDGSFLDEASRLLEALLDRAPGAFRDRMVENHPIYREVRAAL